MQYINKIKYSLNNECGGPNLEVLIGIGTSMAAFIALQKLGGSIIKFIAKYMETAAELSNV
jgi:hypothetical protein